MSGSLPSVWRTAFLEATSPRVTALTPLRASITAFDKDGLPIDDISTRGVVDTALQSLGWEITVVGTANTIFPHSLWRPGVSRKLLFDRYRRILPQLKKRDSRNRNGTYFERLTSTFANGTVNQLDHIIDSYNNGVHRKTALQASLFDPARDHTRQRRRGFPCLQHITFSPTPSGGLVTTGFYAFQYVFVRAYGNYLGLCWLARFMAHEMGLHVERVDCYATIAELGETKARLAPLTKSLASGAPV